MRRRGNYATTLISLFVFNTIKLRFFSVFSTILYESFLGNFFLFLYLIQFKTTECFL